MNVFIFHGTYGSSKENWFPWLKQELERKGIQVIVPDFPTPQNQSLETWTNVFEMYFDLIDEETIFVGHSLGSAFALRLLERTNKKIRACFLVAGFVSPLGGQYDTLNESFLQSFDWNKIRNNCNSFYVIQSDNDLYVPLAKALELSKKLNTEMLLIPNAGHFNEKAGYSSFELLLEKIVVL